MKNRLVVFSLIAIILMSLVPLPSVAADEESFNPNFILSDHELTSYTSMNLGQIQKFLDERKGILKYHLAEDVDGGLRTAAEIIFNSAHRHKINPKVILTVLQKEQSLLEDATPTEKQLAWAAGYAVCDACKTDDEHIQKYRGFGIQVDYAAGSMRFYIDQEFGFQPGKLYVIDGREVTPANRATAAFYNYTPHYHGNLNFWKLWNSYFIRSYPDGSLLQARGEDGVWLLENGLKRPILTKSALTSRFDISKILIVQPEELEKYSTGRSIKFAEFSLLRSPGGTVFLLVNDTLRGFASREAFMKIGFTWDEVENVEWDDINAYPKGLSITEDSVYPVGQLVQNNKTGGIYFVQDGMKHPIWSADILRRGFGHRPIVAASPEDLEQYTTGMPITYGDGELLKAEGEPAIWVVSNGEKRLISSADVFNDLGYDWDAIIEIPKKILDLHPTGDPLR